MWGILRLGYNLPLESADLSPLPDEEKVKIQFEKIAKKLRTGSGIISTCLRTNLGLVMFGALLRLLADVLGFSGALGLQIIVSSIQDGFSVQQHQENRTGIKEDSKVLHDSLTFDELFSNIVITSIFIFIASIGQGSFSQLSSHLLSVAGIRFRNSLQVCLYQKALHLSVGRENKTTSILDQKHIKNSRTENDSNDKNKDEISSSNLELGLILNIIYEDSLNIRDLIWNLHHIWSIPLRVSIVIVLVYFR
ncbi:ATP-binding cassette sub-family C member Sur [Eurytemora carolleeae]|uniref:ATP-binding cassette sub-family C member Sur n=1 Tax=Eurytemora carolleeae TaxID=1294199 RepID=UPI000C7950DB|nr:ATP-binding cassette sub-family C member Sur [Eurytemora carolleeae]|eukprot:XP_023349432.1 ATP-binding cassette sub-family C member Sur-like [Eurytemora affinis]